MTRIARIARLSRCLTADATALLIRVLPVTLAVVGVMLVLASETRAQGCCFTGGPSVRVSLNTIVEIRWTANFVGDGRVEIFDNSNGAVPIAVGTSSVSGAGHTIEIGVSGVLQPDTAYFFRVIHKDPTNVRPDLTYDPAPYPPFFTGVQAIGNVFANPDITSAVISWEANVLGYGSVVYGTTALDQGPVEDTVNITNHAIELTGLSPGTTYQFRVSNKHAIDRTSLAEATGQFTTDTEQLIDVVLTQPHADPRVIGPTDSSTLSVRARHQGQPVAGVVVWFDIDPGSSGGGAFNGASSAQATTDANGVASVQMRATGRGLVHVNVSSAGARNPLTMPVVVR